MFLTGAQEHFYLETQTSLVVPGEGEEVTVFASPQNPTLTQVIDAGCQNTTPNTSLDFFLQMTVASVLGVGAHRVVVKVKRMGGGFGGKESRFGIFTFTLFLTFNFHSHVDPFL